MHFRFTDDQRALQAGVREFLDRECTAEHVRQAAETGSPSRERWKRLADLGVVGATAPEEQGGLGLNELDLVLVLEEAGRAALPEPLLEVSAIAVPLLAEADQAAWLDRVVDGGSWIVIATDRLVPFLEVADAAVTATSDALHLVEVDDVEWTRQETIDRTRPLATFDTASVGSTLDVTSGALQRARNRGALGAAAMLVGLATRMLDLASQYACTRHQFGVPIGTFQAIKHQLADSFIKLEFARPAVYRAAYSSAANSETSARDIAMAKVMASDAAAFTARSALQTHGAIGYTWEHDLHLWMEKVWSLSAAYGTRDEHWQVLSRDVLEPTTPA